MHAKLNTVGSQTHIARSEAEQKTLYLARAQTCRTVLAIVKTHYRGTGKANAGRWEVQGRKTVSPDKARETAHHRKRPTEVGR